MPLLRTSEYIERIHALNSGFGTEKREKEIEGEVEKRAQMCHRRRCRAFASKLMLSLSSISEAFAHLKLLRRVKLRARARKLDFLLRACGVGLGALSPPRRVASHFRSSPPERQYPCAGAYVGAVRSRRVRIAFCIMLRMPEER